MGARVAIPRCKIRELKHAQPKDLSSIYVLPGGEAISIDALDVDISSAGLVAEELGSFFARYLGGKTKGVTTPKKAEASRANGLKGGRPKKHVA